MYRSRKLLGAAKGQQCTLNLPGVCRNNPETVVAAHSNQLRHGKGAGLKAHDCFTAWACSECHAELDQGKRFSYEEKVDYWQRGFERTVLQLFLQGIVQVK